jgi:PCFT/HCP family folate transporter-like MFS transporter 1/3
MFWRSLPQNVLPLILVLFIGAWSDRNGRKIPMVAVLIAYVIQDLGLILCSEVRSTWLTSSWTIVVLTSLVPGLVGGDQSFGMTVFNHITDTSTDDERTFLNGCAMAFIFGGVAFGYLLGGLATTLLTYTEIFLCTMVIELGVLAYIWFYLEDRKGTSSSASGIDANTQGYGFLSTLKSFGDLNLVRDTFQTIFKRRDGKVRMALFLLVLAHIFAQTPWMGKKNYSNEF